MSTIHSHPEPLTIEYDHPDKEPSIEDAADFLPENLLRKKAPGIPDLTEWEIIRHFTHLSTRNFGVDNGFYPLGSCTMKYNPRINEAISARPELTSIHPEQDESTMQGSLRIMYELQKDLAVIGGVDAITLQPAAGAHGEFTGLLIVRAFHELNGEGEKRTDVVLPDTAHGTNPASAAMAGYNVIETESGADGCVDLDALEAALGENTAAFMLTNPNTLGIFEHDVLEAAKLVHKAGALLYYDGANLNAIMGKTTPGKMGFDIVHFNLHKTFSTPHGGGGPGSGPIGVTSRLRDFLPVPIAGFNGESYYLDYDIPHSIGKIKQFFGNFGVLARAYVYIKILGARGLEHVSERAVLNAAYLKEKLIPHYDMPFKKERKHEFVLSGENDRGFRTLDIAKRLLDYGVHAPTIYFPLLVHEALMIEPTETESKANLDNFIEAMIRIHDEDPETLKQAPCGETPVCRVDELYAAKNLVLNWNDMKEE